MDQAAISRSAQPAVEFDLLKNPFVTLRLSLSATKEEIADAFNEALAGSDAADQLLREARRQLLSPKLRLAATVELLVDASRQQRDEAIALLEHTAPLSDLIACAKDLPTAARASYLANVAQLRSSPGLLRHYATTLASIDRHQVVTAVQAIFQTSGVPLPNVDGVVAAIEAHIGQAGLTP